MPGAPGAKPPHHRSTVHHPGRLAKAIGTGYVVWLVHSGIPGLEIVSKPRILIVEDESVIRSALRRLLERNNYQVSEAASVGEADSKHDLDGFDLIISDLRLPGAPGTDLIKRAGDVPVLIMTSYASLRSAVDSMRMGAVDYIAKPFDHNDMLTAVARILDDRQGRRLKQPAAAASSTESERAVEGFIGSCAEMVTLFDHLRKIAPTDATVLTIRSIFSGKPEPARSWWHAACTTTAGASSAR